MNQKLLSKVVATMLVMTLTLANVILLGMHATAYATSDDLEKQSTQTNDANVEFNSYYKTAQGVTHWLKQDINQQGIKLYLQVKVKKGYLKDAKISVFGVDKTDLANITVTSSNESLEMVQKLDIENNQIELKQLNQGTEIVLEIPIVANKSNHFDLSNFSKENTVVLTGSYVNDAGKTIAIEKGIKVRNEWNGTAKAVIEQGLQRYVPYTIGEKKGVLLQTVVKTNLENNNLPVEETKVEITVPTIAGIKPEKVNVVANSTKATNAKDTLAFTQDHWTYDAQNGKIVIDVKNEANENKVAWERKVQDEFVITYIFPEAAISQEGIQTQQAAKVTIKAYNNIATQVEATAVGKIEVKEAIGQIVNQSIATQTQAISKGYLYNKSEKETQYNVTSVTDIGYAELVDNIVIENTASQFVTQEGQVQTAGMSDYFNKTVIRKADFEKMLGIEGSLKIKDQDGATLVTFDKNTQADENGNYVYEYIAPTNKVTIETSKPLTEGKLVMEHTKTLKGQTQYEKAQITTFKTLQMNSVANVTSSNIALGQAQAQATIQLVDPTTKFEASVNTENLSTIVKNENVQFRVMLKTNELSCDLYKNPVIEIVLPNYIQELNIKDMNLLFDDELTIKNYEQSVDSQGNIVVRIHIQGEDTKYNQDEISKGANIVMNTDITLKQLTPTKTEVIKVYVTNENATSYETVEASKERSAVQRGYAQTNLKAVAPVGMVTTNQISGYNDKGETATSISGQEQVGKLTTKASAKTATVTLNVINNYPNVAKNISILGRIPFEGNKDITTGQALGSNLTTTLQEGIRASGIDASKVTIYYSANAEATKDLTNTQNGWSTTVENMGTVKSYLIVLNNHDMNTGDTLGFTYKVTIPEQLGHNKQAYGTYVVYFDNVTAEQTIQDKAVATKVGIATGEGPELEVNIKSDVPNGQNVEEKQLVTYTVTVKNVGKQVAQKVSVSGNIPEKSKYTYFEGEEGTQDGITQRYDATKKEYTEIIDSIQPGETKTIQYMVEVGELRISEEVDEESDELHQVIEEAELIATGKAMVEGYDTAFTSGQWKNKVVQGYLNTSLEIAHIPASYGRVEGQEILYEGKIINVNEVEKKNVVVTDVLPEGVSFVEANENATYDKNTRTVTWNFGTLTQYAQKYLMVKVTVDTLPQGQYERTITNQLKIKTQDKELTSKEVSVKVTKPSLVATQSSQTAPKVTTGNTIQYHVVVKNQGTGTAQNIKVIDALPEGLRYEGAEYVIDGKSYESNLGNNPAIITILRLQAGQVAEITINAKVEKVAQEKEISNVVKVSADSIEEFSTNEIKHTLVPSKDGSDDPSVDVPTEGTGYISGVAWMDGNQDGKRDGSEPTLGGINVMLVNAENGQIVKDITTGKNKEQQTNANGAYTFANLKPGKYMVVFLYDAGNYGVTRYKQAGVNSDSNSDVISMKVNLNGQIRLAGVTNTLELSDSNIENIDIGLIVSPKFDLKLDKVISKIVVNDNKGSTTYDYKDSKLVKLDLNPKTIDQTSIMIEYKIKITNEGGVAGYAKKIVDYLPQDMKFSSEVNQDWYTSDTGNIYNASLANTLIQPGETKELTLLLTKKMSQDNTDVINNNAEIYESYNDLGLADIDSTPANKVQGEDDISNADAIVGIKTGEVYIYTIITLITIVAFGIGIYMINKKVLKKV